MDMLKVTQGFAKYYTESMSKELLDTVTREEKLRASGFPYCGLQHLYKKINTIPAPEMTTAGKEYYTSVGTAAHLVFQRWVGNNGRLLGEWICRKCNHHIKFGKVAKCPNCKTDMDMLYEEFTVRAFKHVSGHLDGIYVDENGLCWLLDYKTTSVEAIRKHRKSNNVFPYGKNVSQIQTYCALIEKHLDIKIAGWLLVYIARDNPLKWFEVVGDTISEKHKRMVIEKCGIYDKQYEIVKWYEKAAKAGRELPYKGVQVLIDTKPCKTQAFYKQHYEGFKGCPVAGVCFNEKLLTKTMKNELLGYQNCKGHTVVEEIEEVSTLRKRK